MQNKDYDTIVRIYKYYNHNCFIDKCFNKANQLAHIIGNTKPNTKRYGRKIIDHKLNVFPACSLKCNALIDLGHNNYLCDCVATIINSNNSEQSKRKMIEAIVKDNIKRKLDKNKY